MSSFPLLERITSHATSSPSSIAIRDIPHDLTITYSQLCTDVLSLSSFLLSVAPSASQDGSSKDMDEMRVCVLCEKGYLVPLVMLATWTSGAISVPLLPSLPAPEQSYIVQNCQSELLICDEKNFERAHQLAKEAQEAGAQVKVVKIDLESIRSKQSTSQDSAEAVKQLQSLTSLDGDRRAMMLYTSGTTGKPKGVVTRHAGLASQVSALVDAWRWTPSDNLLHILPLNHLHGITVALLPTLWAGATVELWEKFDGPAIWRRWINAGDNPITMFFGVPTVYSRLIAAHGQLPKEEQEQGSKASATLRLQVSGSAPLPESVKKTWEMPGGIGGGMILLERYGMTETGIIAGTGWENSKRVKGHIGWPLANVKLRLWDAEKGRVIEEEDVSGEVQVSGPGIFTEYWNLPDITKKEFQDGWFKTGDVAVYSSDPTAKGQLRILGRNSTDIIKSGGEKLSAIEIERAILELEGMKDCAVVGVEDEEWGQMVGVCLVTSRPSVTVADLRKELRSVLAAYKLPKKLKIYEGEIPRNNMGKVNKKKLVLEAFPQA